ncbi:hypothetical protein [Variovorax sp. efr-133-TYG-130]|uniref:hypothetical protein n=1 Tax=Variovorax sp. efr-133-TYG-130 TaxID=3040327 RepID=UPI002557970B|nr:hypothetical protein [Variovorax sp. efr-133-TYG-130]
MSGNGTTGFDRDDERDLRDPALRRALDHAPDSDATPDPRTRDAILKMAHNLAATVPAAKNAAANSASAAPWWRRVFGGGGEPRSRMPWNAAFATVLLATFVTVLWHREPVPDAQLDGEARVAGAAAPAAAPPAPAPAQPAAEAAPPAEPPLAAAPAPRPASPPSAAAKKAPAAEQKQAQARRDAGADAVRRPAPPLQAAPAPAPVAPAPASPSAAVAGQAAPSRSDEQREERLENERRRAYAAEAPAPAAAPAPAIAPPPPPQGDNASADASGALQRAPAPRAAVPKSVLRAEGPAGFTALDRWTSFSFTGSGAEVRHARGDIEGLPALVGTVARSATAPGEALAAPVEARLSLYRGSTLVAVLEIAGGQVRWTPQPGGTALVGTPPAQALDALRALLTR